MLMKYIRFGANITLFDSNIPFTVRTLIGPDITLIYLNFDMIYL